MTAGYFTEVVKYSIFNNYFNILKDEIINLGAFIQKCNSNKGLKEEQ